MKLLIFFTIWINLLSIKIIEDQIPTPIIFKEYGVQINEIEKLKDTIFYEKSSIETFKFIFYDKKGKCFCEHFVNGKIFEKGNYENSLDTLKRYVSGRKRAGTTPIFVQSYFEPLKDGVWIIYKGKTIIKEQYEMGLIK